MPAKIVNVVAKGQLGKKVNLRELLLKITKANFNPTFGGGMAEVAFKKKIDTLVKKEKIEFEVCEETDEGKVAKIRLFNSGKFTINCPDPEFITELEEAFVELIQEYL